MTAFINPQNHHQEDVGIAWLWALLFGPIYFAYKRCYGHALISLVLASISMGLSSVIYAFFAHNIVRNNYLTKGWIEASNHINNQQHEEIPHKNSLLSEHNHVTFNYTDVNGLQTTRDVIVQNIYRYDNTRYITAHCNDSDEQRTFRIDRITSDLTNLSTGEIIGLGTVIQAADNNANVKKITKLPDHLAPPALTSGTLFRIIDQTDYLHLLLDGLTKKEADQLTQQDILNIEPYELELQIDEFATCLTEEKLAAINDIPETAADLLQEQYERNTQSGKQEPITKILATSEKNKSLIKDGYLIPMNRSQATERFILENMTVAQLKPLAKQLNINASQPKQQLIQNISQHIEPTTPLPSLAIPNVEKLSQALANIRTQYNQQAEQCIKNAPPNYAAAIKEELDILNN